jgi:CDP-glycerol glycerophosphotransferase
VNLANRILRVGYNFLSLPWATALSDAWLALKFESLARASKSQLTTSTPKVTVVIPVYNVERYLELCLLSVLAQNYPNLAVIAVNDGSTDNSLSILREFQSRLPLHIVDQNNAGLAAARNAGVDAIAETDYLIFLDSDDALAPGALQALVSLAEQTGSDFVVGDSIRIKGLTRVKRVDTREVYAKGTLKSLTLKDHPAVIQDVTAWNRLFRFEFYRRQNLRFPDGLYFEDMALMTKAFALANKFDVLDRCIYFWRVRTEGSKSITQQTGDDRKFQDRLFALKQMKLTLDDALSNGRATQANLDAFASRVRKHDLKLHPDRKAELEVLIEASLLD